MDMNLIKYPKGSIWWLDSGCLPIGPHITKKNRPVVVVSGDQRGRSEVVEVCTITSQDKIHICEGINVPFRNGYGVLNYIQTNQHFTVPTSCLRDYQGQLSTSVIERLNRSLRFAQDLGELNDLEDKVRSLEHTVLSLRKLDCDKRAIEASLSYLHTVLKELNTYVDSAEKRLCEMKNKRSKNPPKNDGTQRSYIKFTDDNILEYLIDMDSLDSGNISESDFLIKWNIRDMKSAKRKVSYINSKLSKKEEVASQ